jgi:CRP/FNR family cyclic AMP-dependent transcriptional regulator
MVLATLIKWVLIRSSAEFSGEPLFHFGANVRFDGGNAALVAATVSIAYALIVPLQELTARGALQSSLHMFLVGKHRNWLAILVSNVVFTACHLHLSTGFALMAFFPGLIWGALYARQRSLVGVSVSHILLGIWAFSVLGVNAVLPI